MRSVPRWPLVTSSYIIRHSRSNDIWSATNVDRRKTSVLRGITICYNAGNVFFGLDASFLKKASIQDRHLKWWYKFIVQYDTLVTILQYNLRYYYSNTSNITTELLNRYCRCYLSSSNKITQMFPYTQMITDETFLLNRTNVLPCRKDNVTSWLL